MKTISAHEAWGCQDDEDFDEYTKDWIAKFEDPKLVMKSKLVEEHGQFRFALQTVHGPRGFINSIQGVVWKEGEDEPILDIHHDYCDLPHLFIDADDTTYLLIPYHYEHMALVDLNTLEVKYHTDDCWCFAGSVTDEPFNGEYFMLGGCYWGAPYTFRLYQMVEGDIGFQHEWFVPGDAYLKPDGYKPRWTDEGLVVPYMSFKGRDGTTLDDDEWDDKLFNEDGNTYTKEAQKNFIHYALFGLDGEEDLDYTKPFKDGILR